METDLLDAINHSSQQISAKITELSKALLQTSTSQRAQLLAQWREQIDVSDVESVFRDASEADDQDRASQLLLDTLYYEQLGDRRETIAKAHANTFQWIFDEQSVQSVPWTNFASWLSKPALTDGLYWITGKPGSGKSTLMRFLVDDPRTKKCLKRWAKRDELIIASCFFWHSGEVIQKSQMGLLRSLLFQLFSQAPQLMKAACPWRWRSYMSGALTLGPWTNQQLLKALHLALTTLSTTNSKTCIFVDGLDEYEGDNAARSDLVELVKSLSRIPNIKICVSSRPWVVFKTAFEQGPSLQLHHLTQQDIESFIDQELITTDLFIRLEMKDPVPCSQLASEIVEKAKGVFLWVYLVVRDLLECLQNRDGIKDLHRKLNSMPSDLNEFFTSILTRLEGFYFEEACRLFQVAMTADHPLSLLTYSYILEGDDLDPVLMDIKFMADFQISDRCEATDWRLNSRCRGLLEVTTPRRDYIDFRKRVDFLHRTVKDFFESGALDKLIQEVEVRTQSTVSFDANKALARSFLAQIKTVDFDPRELGRTRYIINEIFNCARRYERNNEGTLIDILDSLDHTGNELFVLDLGLNPGEHWMRFIHSSSAENVRDGETFLTAALRRNLRKYLKIKVLQYPSMISQKSGRPLLDYVLRPNGISHDGPFELDVETLELLLSKGADPNGNWHNSTVWGYWLEFIAEYREWGMSAHLELVQPTRLLIRYGALKRVMLPTNKRLEYAPEIIRSAFGRDIAIGDWDNCKHSMRRSLLRVIQFSIWRKKDESP